MIPFVYPSYRKFLRDEAWRLPRSEFEDIDPYYIVDFPPDTFESWWENELSTREPRYKLAHDSNETVEDPSDIAAEAYEQYLTEYEAERIAGEEVCFRWNAGLNDKPSEQNVEGEEQF